jgi:hypothetical protein
LYCNNNLAIQLVTWEEGYPEVWSDLTVNLEDNLESDCAYIDINNNGVEILQWIEDNKLGVPTGKITYSGFCQYPQYKINLDLLSNMELVE